MFVIRLLNPVIRLEDAGKPIFVYLDKEGPTPDVVWNCTDPKEATRFSLVDAKIFQNRNPKCEVIDEIILNEYVQLFDIMES